jgi:phosphoribosylaminoimidazole-succinocarboxamide synthase
VAKPRKLDLHYEGKAKKIFETDDPARYIVEFKDDATAFNARKRGTIAGKGEINNAISATLYEYLGRKGIMTHFLCKLGPREQLVQAVDIIPVEVIIRNRAAGSFANRYGVEEGDELNPMVVEWCLKNDALGDPPMNDATAVALGFATPEQLEILFSQSSKVNDLLQPYLWDCGLELIDFKLEFGVDPDGQVFLADEISPDTCRLWDSGSGNRLDKDRFRRDLGGVGEAYLEVFNRVVRAARA